MNRLPNPNYANAIEKAIEISKDKGVIRDLENLKNSNDNDLKCLATFVENAKNYNQYFNALEIINMGEDTISQILAWLLNVNENGDLQELRKSFCEKFLELIEIGEDKEEIKHLAGNMTCKQGQNNYDILLESKTSNGKNFICVIENKKNAALSCTRSEEKGETVYRTQIERYFKEINPENKKDNNKKFVFISANTKRYLDDKIRDYHVKFSNKPYDINDRKKSTWSEEKCKQHTFIGDKNLGDQKLSDVLEQFDYIPIEHSQIVKILYEVLNDKNCANKSTIEIIESLLKVADNNTNSVKIINKLKENLPSEKVITYDEDILNHICQNKEYSEYADKKGNIRIRGNTKFKIFDMRQKLKRDDILAILSTYIEYWEMHYCVGDMKDNVEGFTKIINGEYIKDTCMNIYDKYAKGELKISDKILDVVREMIKYELFIKTIDSIEMTDIESIVAKKEIEIVSFDKEKYYFKCNLIPKKCDDKIYKIFNEQILQISVIASHWQTQKAPRIQLNVVIDELSEKSRKKIFARRKIFNSIIKQLKNKGLLNDDKLRCKSKKMELFTGNIYFEYQSKNKLIEKFLSEAIRIYNDIYTNYIS